MTLLVTALVLATLAAGWVVHPILFRRWGMIGDVVAAGVVDRESRKRVALAALNDVEYDHAAGKLDEVDYREMRGQLEMEALVALRALDDGDVVVGADGAMTHRCGFQNPAGSRFCAGCGQRLP